MSKFTSFILLHSDGEAMLVNIQDISFIKDGALYLRSCDDGFAVDESLEEINNLIAKELMDE